MCGFCVGDDRLASAVGNPTFAQIVRGHFYFDAVASEDADIVLTHFAGDMGNHFMSVFKADAKHGIGQCFSHDPFELDQLFFVGQSLPSGLGKAHII